MQRKVLSLIVLLCLLLGTAPRLLAQDQPIVVVPTVDLRVRAYPATNAPRLAVVPKGTNLAALGRDAGINWIQVSFQGTIGWVSAFYLTSSDDLSTLPVTDGTVPDPNRPEERQVAPDGTVVLTGQLIIFSAYAEVNVRSRPSESAAILGVLSPNERATVTLLDSTRSWGQISFNGQLGWVALYAVTVLGDIRTVAIEGNPASGSDLPVNQSPFFSPEQRGIVEKAQRFLSRAIPNASSLIDILNNGAASGLIQCSPIMPYFRDYVPTNYELELVSELAAVRDTMNAAFDLLNDARARWVIACDAGQTLLYKDQFPQWLATAQQGGALLNDAQRQLAELSAR